MITKKYSLIVSLLFSVFIFCNGQQISVSGNVGMQGLSYKIEEGDNELKIGGRLGVGYTYFLSRHLGIVTGLDIGSYRNETTLVDGLYSSDEVDTDGEIFEFRVHRKGYKEVNKFTTVSIPLMLQYRTLGETQFYFNGGGRVFFPFGQKSTISMKELDLRGYYSEVNVELFDLPNHGFEKFYNWESSSKTKFNTGFALSAETGFSFELKDNLRLYTGIYLDYGLTDMQKKEEVKTTTNLINYNDKGYEDKEFNSILKGPRISESAKLMAYGIQLKLEFGPRYRGRGCGCY